MSDYGERSVNYHKQLQGKIEVSVKRPVETMDDLSLAYTPGVAAPCMAIARDDSLAREMTIKNNTIAIVSDGSAVLGLGNIGAAAAMPVMEGKSLLFKQFGDVNAVPLCIDTQDPDEIITFCRQIATTFGGINLEDISAPRCFKIERALQDLGIPVFHDDQHGTAIAVLAALLNASKVTGKPLEEMRIVISGAGAAGVAIVEVLLGVRDPEYRFVKDVLICDSKGLLSTKRSDLNEVKQSLLDWTNAEDMSGSLQDALVGADVFIGVSKGGLLTAEDIRAMNEGAIVLAMANPDPEIMPDEARAGGAAIVATGRSDFANQVNNALVFPGLFRGALDAQAERITPAMWLAAAQALADCVEEPTAGMIVPQVIGAECDVAGKIASAVYEAALAGAGFALAD
jgi:malate dehydrogenase (oxaloacetate-decarboxylating)